MKPGCTRRRATPSCPPAGRRHGFSGSGAIKRIPGRSGTSCARSPRAVCPLPRPRASGGCRPIVVKCDFARAGARCAVHELYHPNGLRSGGGGRPDERRLRPQTNIVSSGCLRTSIRPPRPKTQAELRSAYGITRPASLPLSPGGPNESGLFAQHRSRGRTLLFVVPYITRRFPFTQRSVIANGTMNRPRGLVHFRPRLPSTFAHEAVTLVGHRTRDRTPRC